VVQGVRVAVGEMGEPQLRGSPAGGVAALSAVAVGVDRVSENKQQQHEEEEKEWRTWNYSLEKEMERLLREDVGVVYSDER
jgi:hypothetical protein